MSQLGGSRVLVTGGSGFLGRHVVRELKRWNADPVTIRSQQYDLTDVNAIRRALKDTSPRYVIHCAAKVGGIGANQAYPAEFFYENAVMGIHLIHEAWKADVEKLVIVGTVCSYPKFTNVPFSEDDFWSGYPEDTNAPYGLAKKMLLVQAQAYREQYGFNAVTLIPTNLYGPGDNFDLHSGHVIPAIIRKCVDARNQGTPSVGLWGTGEATREFLFVTDAASAIVRALTHLNVGDPLNLGSGQEIAIRDLANAIANATGFRGSFLWDRSKPDGQPRRRVDSTRAERCLQFEPSVPLNDGLRLTVEWYESKLAEAI